MWGKIKIPRKDQSFHDDTDFALFMKWFEVFAEDTIFETNSFRRTILSETIERLSSLLKVQKIAARCLRVYSKGCMLDKKKPVMDNPRSIRNQQLLKSSPNMYSVLSRNVSNDELIEVEKLFSLQSTVACKSKIGG